MTVPGSSSLSMAALLKILFVTLALVAIVLMPVLGVASAAALGGNNREATDTVHAITEPLPSSAVAVQQGDGGWLVQRPAVAPHRPRRERAMVESDSEAATSADDAMAMHQAPHPLDALEAWHEAARTAWGNLIEAAEAHDTAEQAAAQTDGMAKATASTAVVRTTERALTRLSGQLKARGDKLERLVNLLRANDPDAALAGREEAWETLQHCAEQSGRSLQTMCTPADVTAAVATLKAPAARTGFPLLDGVIAEHAKSVAARTQLAPLGFRFLGVASFGGSGCPGPFDMTSVVAGNGQSESWVFSGMDLQTAGRLVCTILSNVEVGAAVTGSSILDTLRGHITLTTAYDETALTQTGGGVDSYTWHGPGDGPLTRDSYPLNFYSGAGTGNDSRVFGLTTTVDMQTYTSDGNPFDGLFQLDTKDRSLRWTSAANGGVKPVASFIAMATAGAIIAQVFLSGDDDKQHVAVTFVPNPAATLQAR